MANVFHALEVGEVASTLATDAATGLSPDEARARLERVGPNRVGDYRGRPLWRLVLDQFRSLVVLLLLAAAAVAWPLSSSTQRSAPPRNGAHAAPSIGCARWRCRGPSYDARAEPSPYPAPISFRATSSCSRLAFTCPRTHGW